MKKTFKKISKNIEKNQKKYVTIALILLFAIALITATVKIYDKKDKSKDNDIALGTITDVVPEEVKALYRVLENAGCGGAQIWKLSANQKLKVTDMTNGEKMNLIFSKLNDSNILSKESIKKSEYDTATKEIFGSEYTIPELKTFTYDGYTYTLSGNKVTKTVSSCKVDKEYVSVLYGYSYNEDNLSVYVNVGYVKDKDIYTVDDKKLATYDESKKKDLLDKSTSYLYTYTKENNKYILKSVELCIKEVN